MINELIADIKIGGSFNFWHTKSTISFTTVLEEDVPIFGVVLWNPGGGWVLACGCLLGGIMGVAISGSG